MADPSTWLDLRDQYFEIHSTVSQGTAWIHAWQVFVRHPWYLATLGCCAKLVVRRCHAPTGWIDDVQQDAVLFLRRDLRRSPRLGLNLHEADEQFPNWIVQITKRHCLQAIRRMRRPSACRDRVKPEDLIADTSLSIEQRLDFSLLRERLEPRERTVLILTARGYTLEEIASLLPIGKSTVHRVLQRAIRSLRREL